MSDCESDLAFKGRTRNGSIDFWAGLLLRYEPPTLQLLPRR